MRNIHVLPNKISLERALTNGAALVIYPDGKKWFSHNPLPYIGMTWYSTYWNEMVEIVELSGDKKTCWVEEIS